MDSRFGYLSVIDDNIALRVLAPAPAMSRVYGDAEGALRCRGPAVLSNCTMAGTAASLPTLAKSPTLRPVCPPGVGIKWTAGL